MEFTIHHQILLIVFVTAMVMGAVVNKTDFCTMGAVSDWVNMGDKGRIRAWLLAMAVALGGVLVMEAANIINIPANESFPPYRTTGFAWLRYVLGGFLFGIGMTLGSGCGNKTLVRIGGGNIKSLVVLIVASTMAYLMLWTDFFGLYVLPWATAGMIDLAAHGIANQELGAILGGLSGMADTTGLHLLLGALIVAGLLYCIFKSEDFRGDHDKILGGAVVGIAVLVGWYITGSAMGVSWKEWADFSAEPPTRVAVQSFTFISPMGDTARYVLNPKQLHYINFGVMALTGVIVGSFLYSVISRRFRIEWFVNGKDAANHIVGGALMGFGGVLAMGCTVGQAITGISTLALGSILTFVSIVFGSALTMKVQYNMLDEQTFLQALRTSLAELRLMPRAS